MGGRSVQQELTSRESEEQERGLHKQTKLNKNQVNYCFLSTHYPVASGTWCGGPKKDWARDTVQCFRCRDGTEEWLD